VKLWMLGSGSNGNAILVECEGSRLLIDCGFGSRVLAGRLTSIGVVPESIDACVLTHEHHDHAKGAAAAAKRWGWGVFATRGTAISRELRRTRVHLFEPGATLSFPTMTVEATTIPHDARQPVGFVVTGRSTGARAGLFYDFGRITRAIARVCDSLDVLVLESNHDDELLRNGPYPPFLRDRIAGAFGHLSNRRAGVFARDIATRRLNHLVLAHLSQECNTESVAMSAMRTALGKSRFAGTITAAKQDSVVGPFMPGKMKAEQPVQYSLF
jgi:phosphoribosyl 1,2-cyclic phosphodiesterase